MALVAYNVLAVVRAAMLSEKFQPWYTAIVAVGKNADGLAGRQALGAIPPIVAGSNRATFVLDDTRTKRYGPKVQGAGVHHNPTLGPAGSPCVYEHCRLVLGLLATHKA